MRLFALAALVAVGCDANFFTQDKDIPEGFVCSDSKSCPPGQQCVAGEQRCRIPCSTPSVGGGGPNASSGCNNIASHGNGGFGYNCDVDRYCRPTCNGGSGGGGCSVGCSTGEVCDVNSNICRPSCIGGCGAGFGCTSVQGGNPNVPGICLACKPGATTTFKQPAFAMPVRYAASTRIVATAVADLAGSGKPAVLAVDGNQALYVYANAGDGTLTGPTTITLPSAGRALFDVVAADFTGDGKLDVVVSGGNSAFLLVGHGDGTLSAPMAGPMTWPASEMAVGDFDGDGHPDFVSDGQGTTQLSVQKSDAAGALSFIAKIDNFHSGSNMQPQYVAVAAADFNHDGKLDFIADNRTSTVELYLNQGGGAFSNGNMSMSVGLPGMRVGFWGLAAFDVDGDGKPDAVTATTAGGGSSGYALSWTHGRGDGTFGNTSGNPNVPLPGISALATGDFDSDGHVDLAVADGTAQGQAALYIVSGDGKELIYSAMVPIPAGAVQLSVGDVDGDGRPDVVTTAGSGIAVLINQTM